MLANCSNRTHQISSRQQCPSSSYNTLTPVSARCRKDWQRSRTNSTSLNSSPVDGPVICVGEALFDMISNQPGLPREAVTSWTPHAGGAPANVAAALARLGVRTKFLSALGKDAAGDELVELLKDCGVDVSGVARLDAPTRDVYVVLDKSGDREFAGFGRPTECYADYFIDAQSIAPEDVKSASVIVTGTLGLAAPMTRASLEHIAELKAAGSAVLLVDVNWRPVFWGDAKVARETVSEFLQSADIIKISDSDLGWLLGMEVEDALRDACLVLQRFPNAKGVLITAGESGSSYCFRSLLPGAASISGNMPAFKVDTVDTTGAGDAFTAGFIYKMLQAGGLDRLLSSPDSLKATIRFSAATGALTTTRSGAITGQPQLHEVLDLCGRN